MTKRIVLTALAAFMATVVALAQTEPAPSKRTSPANKSEKVEKAQQKDKAAKVEHAEERSNGAAYSGKGKGGEKNMADKAKKDKAKGKKKGQKNKNKHKNKAKGKDAQKGKKSEDNDDKAPSDSGQEQRPGGTTQKAPTTTPTARKQRQPGDKPSPGTEQKKDDKSRG